MTEAVWLAGTDVHALVRFAAEQLSTRRQRLLAVAFCRAGFELPCSHTDLIPSLVVLERYAEGHLPEADAERERQRCRALAQQLFELSHGGDAGTEPTVRAHAQSELAWALAFAFNYAPVPVEAIYWRVVDAVERAGADFAGGARQIVWEVAGNPFRPVAFSPDWRTSTVLALARQMYDAREFGAMPILADALQDAGCDNDDVLNHCREPGDHVRGCWVCDGVLGKA